MTFWGAIQGIAGMAPQVEGIKVGDGKMALQDAYTNYQQTAEREIQEQWTEDRGI